MRAANHDAMGHAPCFGAGEGGGREEEEEVEVGGGG